MFCLLLVIMYHFHIFEIEKNTFIFEIKYMGSHLT